MGEQTSGPSSAPTRSGRQPVLIPLGLLDYPAQRPPHTVTHAAERAHVIIVRVPLVVRPLGDRYVLVCGDDALAEARRLVEDQEPSAALIPADIADWYTEEQLAEMALIEGYRCARHPALVLSQMLLAHRERYGLSQQELARRVWITPGTIHHYESLDRALSAKLKEHLRAERLTFKECRSLADVSEDERQEELALPFIEGRLSSVYIERVVSVAKAHPAWSAELVFDEVLRDNRAAHARVVKAEPVHRDRPPPVNLGQVERMFITTTADLRNLARATTSELDRMRLSRLFLLHYGALVDAAAALKLPLPGQAAT